MQIFKNKLVNLLLSFGLYIKKTNSITLIRDLITNLHPVQVDLIRIGGSGDGGYLVPNDFNGITTCFSPGVSTILNFELELSTMGVKCFLADFSVDLPKDISKNINFIKKFVAPFNSDTEVNFQEWVDLNLDTNGDSILQMDIEGAEYSAILSCNIKTLRRFRIIVVEFHNLDSLFEPSFSNVIFDTFKKLLMDFHVVHIHPNNHSRVRIMQEVSVPSTMEFTFYRKDRIHRKQFAKEFPHKYDMPNDPNRDDLILPKNWYRYNDSI
jgi:hypothetical protein